MSMWRCVKTSAESMHVNEACVQTMPLNAHVIRASVKFVLIWPLNVFHIKTQIYDSQWAEQGILK